MQRKMYSIRDSKGEVFHPPFLQLTHGEAERFFTKVANDFKTTISEFPEDYDLYYLGTFDDVSGKVETLPTPQHMLKGVHVAKRQPRAFNDINAPLDAP